MAPDSRPVRPAPRATNLSPAADRGDSAVEIPRFVLPHLRGVPVDGGGGDRIRDGRGVLNTMCFDVQLIRSDSLLTPSLFALPFSHHSHFRIIPSLLFSSHLFSSCPFSSLLSSALQRTARSARVPRPTRGGSPGASSVEREPTTTTHSVGCR